MTAITGFDRGLCMHLVDGKACGCQLWKPSSDNRTLCDCCGCYVSFHKRFDSDNSAVGRCRRLCVQGVSPGEDGCQSFFSSAGDASVCEGCGCHQSYHEQPEARVGNLPIVDTDRTLGGHDDGERVSVEIRNAVGDRDQDLQPKHKVFLSHTGAQKIFVANLCSALEKRHRFPFFDKRRSSLPVGDEFPKLIFDAIEQCLVGVVVLSEDFVKKKWPMLELVAMWRESKKQNRIRTIPVFYKKFSRDCLNSANYVRWEVEWKVWASMSKNVYTSINTAEWKEALEWIRGIDVEDCVEMEGLLDVDYREAIVKKVCGSVASETAWDDSKVQGKERLCEEVRRLIYRSEQRTDPEAEVRVVGLFGMAGSGKTTFCKTFCNMVADDFQDKVRHIDIGDGNGDRTRPIGKEVEGLLDLELGTLVDLNEIAVCKSSVENSRPRVFLAIDDVTDNLESIHQAKRLIKLFSVKGSVILLTARSSSVLAEVGVKRDDWLCMPDLEECEAKALFLFSAGLSPGVVDEGLLMQCLRMCKFYDADNSKSHFLPLALKVLGSQFGSDKGGYDLERWKGKLERSDTFNQLRHSEHPIFSVLRSSFDSIEEEHKLIFMDIALFSPEFDEPPTKIIIKETDGEKMSSVLRWERDGPMITMFEWLRMVHGKEESELNDVLEALEKKSVLENIVDDQGQRSIRIHDLWRKLAVAESKAGNLTDRKWFYEPQNCNGLLKLGGVSSVCLGFNKWNSSKTVNVNRVSTVGVLKLLDTVPDLVLKVDKVDDVKSLEVNLLHSDGRTFFVRDKKMPPDFFRFAQTVEFSSAPFQIDGLRNLQTLRFLRLRNLYCSPCVEEIEELTDLQFLELTGSCGKKIPEFNKLRNLQFLNLRDFQSSGDLVLHLPALVYLDVEHSEFRKLDVSGCMSLRRVWGLRRNACLEELNLSRCHSLEELPNLQMCERLRALRMPDCRLIRSLRGLSGLWSLQTLDITGCEAMTELRGISDSVALEELQASGCKNLAKLPILTKVRKEVDPVTKLVEEDEMEDEDDSEAEDFEIFEIDEDGGLGLRPRLLGRNYEGYDGETFRLRVARTFQGSIQGHFGTLRFTPNYGKSGNFSNWVKNISKFEAICRDTLPDSWGYFDGTFSMF